MKCSSKGGIEIYKDLDQKGAAENTAFEALRKFMGYSGGRNPLKLEGGRSERHLKPDLIAIVSELLRNNDNIRELWISYCGIGEAEAQVLQFAPVIIVKYD